MALFQQAPQQQSPQPTLGDFYMQQLINAQQLQQIQAAKGTGTANQDAVTTGFAGGQLQNYLQEQQKYAAVPKAQAGVMNPDGSVSAPYLMNSQGAPVLTADGRGFAPGQLIQDINGERLDSQESLSNQAAKFRASQGYNPGEASKDQMQAKFMTDLSHSILSLPAEDRHLAYERAMGLAAGKGVIEMNEAPPWDKGGRELTQHIADQSAATQLGVARIQAGASIAGHQMESQNQAALNESIINKNNAMAAKDLREGNTGPSLDQQLKQASLDEKMGRTGGEGQPVGAPISARAAKTYTAASEALDHVEQLRDLLANNPHLSILGAKLAGTTGINRLLTPEQQKFNTLTMSLNDSMKNMGGEGGVEKAKLDQLSHLLPTIGDHPENIANKLEILTKEAANIRNALDPSGHIQRSFEQLPQPGQAPQIPVQNPPQPLPSMQAATTNTPQLSPEQWAMIRQLRAQKGNQ